MSELDFDRSLPPQMPNFGSWFNDRIAEVVEAAEGDESVLATARIELPEEERCFGIPMVTYPSVSPKVEEPSHG